MAHPTVPVKRHGHAYLLYLLIALKKAEVKGRGGRSRRDKKKEEEEEDDGPILPRYRAWEEAQAAVEAADRWDAGTWECCHKCRAFASVVGRRCPW